jgi:hypothetical protein
LPLIAAQDMNQPTVSRIDKTINEKLMFQLYGRSTFGRLASPRINVHEKPIVVFKHIIIIN